MQNLRRCHATSELAVDIHILTIDRRLNRHLCAASLGAFVDPTGGGNVCMLINDARR